MNTSNKLKERIEYINKINNEDCKFLCNMYTNLNYMNTTSNLNDYLKGNNCILDKNIAEIIEYCIKNKSIIITLGNGCSQRLKNLYSVCSENQIPVFSVLNVSEKLLKQKFKSNEFTNIFLDIDASAIYPWYNWNVELENNFKSMLNKLSSTPLEKLEKEPESIIHDIITNTKSVTQNSKTDKIKITSLIKKLDKFSDYINTSNRIIANIYTSDNAVNSYYILELSELLKALTYKTNEERYKYIYITLCSNLEFLISKYNYCLFENNKCIAQRQNCNWPKNTTNGCCFDVNKNIGCTHLNCKSCDIKCISCRLFTCRYLKDRCIDFNVRKNILIKCFMNMFQRPELIWNFFTEEDIILQKVKRFSIKK